MTSNDKESSEKVPKFECKFCNYITIRESQYTRHLMTRKHKMMTDSDIKVPKSSALHICICGKSYKYRQGLSQHRKKCSFILDENENVCQPIQNTNVLNTSIITNDSENNYKEM